MTDQPEPSGVFAKGVTPPPPPTAQPAPDMPALPATALGRFTFHALIPALLLPLLVTLCSLGGTIVGYGFDWLFVGAFCMILLGSMTLNTWLLLRHPESWRLRALPKGLAILHLILWGAQVLGAILSALTAFNGATLALGFVLMAVSVTICVLALARKSIRTAVVPEVGVGLSSYARGLAFGYFAVVALALVFTVIATLTLGPIAALFVLVVAGLPWSWPIAVVGLVAGGFVYYFVAVAAVVLMVAGVVLNVVVVVKLLTQPAFRVRFVNWFFKLRSGDPQVTIRTFAPPPPPVAES